MQNGLTAKHTKYTNIFTSFSGQTSSSAQFHHHDSRIHRSKTTHDTAISDGISKGSTTHEGSFLQNASGEL
jgi:hypothetical protein